MPRSRYRSLARNRDEITTAAMIGTEDQPFAREASEGGRDVGRRQAGAIGADHNNLVIAKIGNFLQR